MATEYVLRIPLDRHIINTQRPFATVIEEIREHIRRPETGGGHAPSSGSGGGSVPRANDGPRAQTRLVGLAELDVDSAPPGGRVVRLFVDVPAARDELDALLSDAGANYPVTILVQEVTGVGTRLVYDSVASAVSVYQDGASLASASRLDAEILSLLRKVTDGA